MTNLEKLMKTFFEDKNDPERQCVAGDTACKMLSCEKCPLLDDEDEKEPCFVKLGKWALSEAKE